MRFALNGEVLEDDVPTLPVNISPDGRWSAFIGERSGSSGLWLYDVENEDFRFLTPAPASDAFLGHTTNKNVVWSPDSRSIAYTAVDEEPGPVEQEIKVISRILFKTRTSFTDNLNTHIYVIDIDGSGPRQVTEGIYDEHSLTWSPDGSKIAFVSNRTADPDDNHNNDIWTVELSTGRISAVTQTPGTEFSPAWSPDGRYLAYRAGVRPVNTKDSQAENAQIYIVPAAGGDPINLTGKLDRRVRNYRWSLESDYIYFTANNLGATHLFRVSVQAGEIEQLVDGDVSVGGFALSPEDGMVIYQLSSQTDPGELWSMTSAGRNPRQLTRYQDEFKNNVVMSVPEVFWFESFDGTMVQGWLMKPNPFVEGRKYPLIQTIHGGPHGAYGFSISASNQAFAEGGFGVLYVNPRGSTGYGQKFADGTINNWGGGDYQDLMTGLDYVVEHNDWIDEERLGVMGGSYGGYMTNWVITQTDRFKAAIAMASVSNLISFYGNSLYQLLIETEFPGELWDNYDLLWHWSPMKHVANVVTPTLFLHGEKDHDVPITQAEEMFIALKKLGVETVFVRYPGEGHGFRRSEHWQDASRRISDWFDQYLEPDRVVMIR
jgi:dipeptidyl aminopeptidase/acylaminoacyl peptidase